MSRQDHERRRLLRRHMAIYRLVSESRDALIRTALEAGFEQQQIAEFMGIGTTTIWRVKYRRKG